MLTLTCKNCNKTFQITISPSQVGTSRGRYCSLPCKHAGVSKMRRAKRLSRDCLMCGISFQYPKASAPLRYCSNICRQKDHANIANFAKGKRHGNWKGGLETFHHKIRTSPANYQWRKAVLNRDNHACVDCGSTERLEVDHIKRFADFPELRFDVSNGRTLCNPCHRATPTYGRYGVKEALLC